jgi:hypothetical protein
MPEDEALKHQGAYGTILEGPSRMRTTRVHLLPHQSEAVYGYLPPLPRSRHLMALDAGAAKTIMGGLLYWRSAESQPGGLLIRHGFPARRSDAGQRPIEHSEKRVAYAAHFR